MKLITIVPENFKMDGGACFGVVPKAMWSKIVPADENNLVNLSSRCLLVDTGARCVLIDTGLGNKQSEKYYSHFHIFDRIGLENALMQQGYNIHDVTDVILTHLHFDHAGGATQWDQNQKAVPVFPNATYYCSKAQWDTAIEPNPREKASYFGENYLTLFENGRLEFIHEAGNFCEGIDLEIKYGHTKGLLVPLIKYNNHTTIVFTADFIPTVLNVPLAWVPAFDIDPLISMQEKEEFLNRALDNGYVLFFEHDYYNQCCKLVQTDKGIKAGDIFTLSDIE
jgi:glyoxylase-like metal-dependent hydrolase (beta-lactamase superfamily II)